MLFAFRLAKELGTPDVGALLQSLTPRQFGAWIAYSQIEPFGEERADLRVGFAAAKIASIFVKSGTRLSPSDFIPQFGSATPGSGSAPRSRSKPKPLTDPADWNRFVGQIESYAKAKG